MDNAIYLYGRETALKKNDERTRKIATKGGIASGESRYLKSLRRKQIRKTIADLAYCSYMQDVTEKELKAFIRFRHREGEKAILAETYLKDDDKESSHQYASCFLKGCIHVYGTQLFLSAREIFERYQDDYSMVQKIFNDAILEMMSELEDCHYNPYIGFKGYSRIEGYKEKLEYITKHPREYRPKNEPIKPIWTKLCVNAKPKKK